MKRHRCPDCGGPLVYGEGCACCPVCGFTACGLYDGLVVRGQGPARTS